MSAINWFYLSLQVTKYYPFAGKTRSKVDRNVSGWETINFCYGWKTSSRERDSGLKYVFVDVIVFRIICEWLTTNNLRTKRKYTRYFLCLRLRSFCFYYKNFLDGSLQRLRAGTSIYKNDTEAVNGKNKPIWFHEKEVRVWCLMVSCGLKSRVHIAQSCSHLFHGIVSIFPLCSFLFGYSKE